MSRVHVTPSAQNLWQDFRHAGRTLLTHPGYLITAMLTLALGIGFTTATFTVVNAVLLRPLPYDEPDRLVRLIERKLPQFPEFSVSPGHYLFWREQATAFEGIGAWAAQNVNLDTGAGDPQRVRADRVSANLFPLLGVQPVMGHGFAPDDEVGERARVALLSYGAWLRHFGGDPAVIGQPVRMDREPVTIIGVMPEGFTPPSRESEFWVPLVLSDAERRSFGSHFMGAIARLRPGVTLDRATEDMRLVSQRLVEFNAGSAGWEVLLFELHDYTVDDVRRSLMILFGAVVLVLLIACANVANLLLARGAARQKELAIRSSIGATRGRLLRQLLVEQVSLASVSALAGVLLAGWLLRILLTLVPDALPAHADVSLDASVLAFAVALAIATPLLFGLLPAVQASRPDLRTLMSAGGRQGSAAPARRTRTVIVVAEIALAMMLLVGSGLLLRSFATLVDQSPGFEPSGAILAGVSLPSDRYPQGEPRERFFADFLERVEGLPEVEAVGLAMPLHMVTDYNSGFEIEGVPVPAEGRPLTLFYAVSEGFFDAMKIPLVRGRYLSGEDRRDGHRVIVISEALAGQHFAGQDPIGRRMKVSQGDNEWREIVGVVGNVKQTGLDDRPRAQVYESYLQHPYFSSFQMIVRTGGSTPMAVVSPIREILRGMDRELPLARVRTLDDLVASTVRPQRFSATLISVFGAAALLLAAVGVYGVIAYTVGLRRQEFAVRAAHGARPFDIARLVLGGAIGMAAAGIAIGAVGAWLLRGLIQTVLFDVSAAHAGTYVAMGGVLALVTMAASLVPALRATRVDPVEALRGE
jgi:putative ABC transport system permease protein